MPPSQEPDPRSVAESLFADLLLLDEGQRAQRLEELCAQRRDLSVGLRALWAEWQELRSLGRFGLPAIPAPTAGAQLAAAEPPRVEGFRCETCIGRGGMGEVWQAVELRLGRRVALKLLPEGFLTSETGRERFRREALAAARVQHPGIVVVYAAGEDGGRPWIAQELVPGGRSLRDRIEDARRSGVLAPDHERDTAALFATVAQALEAAHRTGVVHRDLKPQNLLLTPRGEPKVADFGLARLEGEAALSRSGEFLGTWLYASPEHLSASTSGVEARSDVFSLGVALYECLTLQRPFAGDSGPEIAAAILRSEPTPVHLLRPRIPRDLSVVCMKALEKRPSERYASMGEFEADLRRFLAHEPVRARPPGVLGRARRWSRRHPAWATGLALGSLALGVLTLSLWRTLAALEDSHQARAREAQANAQLADSNTQLRLSRDVAREDRAVSDDVVRVLTELFTAADPSQLGRSEPTVRELVQRGVARLRAGEPAAPRARARLAGTLGAVLNTLGDWSTAEELLSETERTWRELGLSDGLEARAARCDLAEVQMNLGHSTQAHALAGELVALWRAGQLDDGLGAKALFVLGTIESRAGKLSVARGLLEESLELREELLDEDALELVYTRSNLGQVLWREGRFAEGLALLEPDVERLRPFLERGNPLALDGFNTRAMLLQGLGRFGQAEEVMVDALLAAEQALGREHPRSINMRTNLGTILEDLGRLEEAEALFEESIELASEHLGPRVPEAQVAKNDLAGLFMKLGRLEEAESLLRELLVDIEATQGPEHMDAARTRLGLSYCCWRRGKFEEAIAQSELGLALLPPEVPFRRQAEDALELYRQAAADAGAAPRRP